MVSERERAMVVGLVFAGLLAGAVAWLASLGSGDWVAALGSVVLRWISAGAVAGVWVLSAAGWGAAARRTLGWKDAGVGISAAVGLALSLWLAHGLGSIGWPGGRSVAAAWVVAGLGLFAWRVWEGRAAWRATVEIACSHATVLMACVPALAALVVASCVPPGTIWAVEGSGYDTLSYHLALAREWAAAGRLAPLENNAYSWLPSYVEAAYLHLLVVMGAGGSRVDPLWVEASQALSAVLVLVAAVCVGSVARGSIARASVERSSSGRGTLAGVVAAGVVLVTPWSVITGSLAYNEMGMLACLAGAVRCAWGDGTADGRRVSGVTRGVLCGLCLGASVACKPTAAFFGGPLVLMLLLGLNGRGAWPRLLAGAAAGGVLVSGPWLLRNWLAGGNPAFPYLRGVFGDGHWSAEQHARWEDAHHAGGSFWDSAARLVSGEGMFHPAWSVVLGLGVLAGVWAAWRGERAGLGARLLAVGLLMQLMVWMVVGHQQPRFLLACLVTAGPLLGIVAAGLSGGRWRQAAMAAAGAVLLVPSLGSAVLFSRENAGAPCRALSVGVVGVSGAGDDAELARLPEEELLAALKASGNPVAAANLWLRRLRLSGEPSRLYLLGDAGALYHEAPLLWNTTWDAWPLEEARRAAPDDPAAWGRALWERGVTHVLLNLAEVDRLRKSGYSPEAMTPETCAAFVRAACEPVVEWPERGMGLYRLNDAAGTTDSMGP